MNNISATRLTLYAIISSMEMDLRNFIGLNINEVNKEFLLNPMLLEKLKERSHNQGEFDNDPISLIEYLDFGDCIGSLNKFSKFFPKSFERSINMLGKELEKITPIRNRVMHSRPLEFEDFPIISDFLDNLYIYDFIGWNQTGDLIEKLKNDPSIVLNLSIPQAYDDDEEKVYHNLPSVEFDDTGFIGRSTDRREIINKLKGNYPVISIIGEGGVGKTALTLRCLYDLIDDPNQPFEVIIWVSLKTRVLNDGEFRNIDNSIKSTIDMYERLGRFLISDRLDNKTDIQSEIIEYMKAFRILLVLDNLETINSEQIRDFIQRLPWGSKILITSRIGIGEFESRHPIYGFELKDARYYLRRLAQNHRLEEIKRLKDSALDHLCSSLYNNPLAIKWFVSNIAKGDPIESVLLHKGSLLDYCMSNVYEKLTADGKAMLEALLIINRKCSDAELEFLLNFDSIMHRKALNELISTNMVKMETTYSNTLLRSIFYVTEFARDYLRVHYPPSSNAFKHITKKLKQLKGLSQNLLIDVDVNPYSPKSIIVEHDDEKISAFYLKEALKCSKNKDYDKAFEYIDKAKSAVSNYCENYKIAGFLRASMGDIYRADEEYKTALACKIDSAPLMFFYAGFLLTYVEDFDAALDWNRKAEKLDFNNIEIKIQKGRILKQLNKFEEANDTFTEILQSQKLLTLKQQKISIDQASDNLRRWAEKRISQQDYSRALNLVDTAYKIICSIQEKDQDFKILETLLKNVQTLTYIIRQNGQSEKSLNLLIDILHNYGRRIWVVRNYTDISKRLEVLIPIIPSEYKNIIKDYIESNPEVLKDKIESDTEGIIYSKYLSYAFIINGTYDKFNKLFLFWMDYEGDFSSLKIGDKVKFEFGRNEKGVCAKKAILNL